MTTISHTNIEWCKNPDGSKGYVWNPAWGCLNGCAYCYARKIAQRFAFDVALKEKHLLCSAHFMSEKLKAFKPTWIESNYQRQFPKKPSMIFVDSMSDICWWEPDWIKLILQRIKDNPQHTFIILTKRPDMIAQYDWNLPNIWLGVSVSTQADADLKIPQLLKIPAGKHIVSVEPIQERINLSQWPLGWILVGRETGNRKEKITIQPKWIYNLIDQCNQAVVPIFMKNNLFKGGRNETL